MTESIRQFEKTSREYARLNALAETLNAFGFDAWVQDCYFDYGQDWWWTTVIAGSSVGDYQCLYPAQQEKLMYGGLDGFQEVVNEIISKEYGKGGNNEEV